MPSLEVTRKTDPSLVERIAGILREAERSRLAVEPVSDLVPGGLTIDLAHAVCETNVRGRVDAGERLVGYKVGSTNDKVRHAMGLPAPTYGYVFEDMVLASGGASPMGELIEPRIECEICFRLARDLSGPDLTIDEVMEATDAVSASFEICDSRIRHWSCPYPDWLADNGFAARIVLSGRWVPVRTLDLLAETARLSRDSASVAEGSGALVMGHPANAVAWLARALHQRGERLAAGMLVMTGTLTTVTPMEAGHTYAGSFSSLGLVEKTFV